MAKGFLDRVSNKALGELLVEKGALAPEQVDKALELARERGVRLGEALVALGYISRDALGYAIGEQYGLRPMELQPSMVDVDLLTGFDLEMLREHLMLPLVRIEEQVVVVVADPNDVVGLEELSKTLPAGLSLIPQLGAADQIRRCLEVMRPLVLARQAERGTAGAGTAGPTFAADAGAQAGPKDLRVFREVPEPDSEEFVEWLAGLAAAQWGRDVLVRMVGGVLQVGLQGGPGSGGIEVVGEWPHAELAIVRRALLERCRVMEFSRGQAARWISPVRWSEGVYDLAVLMPNLHGVQMLALRALKHCELCPEKAGQLVPLVPRLEPGRYTVILYDPEADLGVALSEFIEDVARQHSVVVSQLATRCVLKDCVAFPAPLGNLVAAVQAAGASLVVFDHPVDYEVATRLLWSAVPPPAVLVCVPLPADGEDLPGEVMELIERQGAEFVKLPGDGRAHFVGDEGLV